MDVPAHGVVVARSAEDTRRLARALAGQLAAGACLGLVGELGAGKTTFVQGLAEGLGITAPVSSPSFLIVQEYPGPLPLIHVDAYRLSGAAELAEIGFEEYLTAGGVVVVEWADRVPDALPRTCRWITFEVRPDHGRAIRLDQASPGAAAA